MAEDKKEVKLSKNAEKVLEEIKKLTVVELAELVKAIEDEFGVSAAAPVAVAGAVAPAGGAQEEEKSSYDVVLEDAGGNKIGAIKAVKEVLGCGLTDAKTMVESAPKAIKEGVSKEEAEEIKKKLEEAGAKVSLK